MLDAGLASLKCVSATQVQHAEPSIQSATHHFTRCLSCSHNSPASTFTRPSTSSASGPSWGMRDSRCSSRTKLMWDRRTDAAGLHTGTGVFNKSPPGTELTSKQGEGAPS
eukprot:1144853-Pelagomonas_calceolata.AAC.3